LKTQPATGETYPKSDLFNKAAQSFHHSGPRSCSGTAKRDCRASPVHPVTANGKNYSSAMDDSG
ncbi:TPA: hypothetical protein ACTYW6_005371, partial [Klebsiella pneumoniae]